MNSLNKFLTATAVSGAILAAPAMAAPVQGNLDATSTGKTTVELEIADRVQITRMDDIPLGTYSGTGDLVYNEGYCVYRNGCGNYKVNVTTDNLEFKVVSASATDEVPFTVRVDGDNDASDGAAILHGADSGNMTGDSATDCGNADNGAIEITLSESDLQGAQTASDYTATITILVTPT